MLSEIKEMPAKAKYFLEHSPSYTLPFSVPYLGMGSSYFAPLAFKLMGIDIHPEIASEFYNYLHTGAKLPNGVLLSQSGKSSEVLWCSNLFEKFTAISNNMDSPLCKFPSLAGKIDLLAGEEKYSSSKTYINTLLALFRGFDIEVSEAVSLLAEKEKQYEEQGKQMSNMVFELLQEGDVTGLYITGSGPNIGTAMQAGLILSESTKLNFTGLPLAQYDHGPKETAKNSIVINIVAQGRAYDRTQKLAETIKAAGANVLTVEEKEVIENKSIINNIVPFNYMAYYLSEKLNIGDTFIVGGKVTEVS